MATETAGPAAPPSAAPTLTPADFAHKWQGVTTTERASAQAQFIDICRMLGEPTPHDADPTGESYAFEKGAEKLGGGDGFADVWKRGHFAWEYKGKKKDLKAAYRQLNDYREDLDNPPLLVVSDLDRFEVHTNFTGTPKRLYAFTLADIAADPTEPLRILRAVFSDPEALRPDMTPEEVTEQAAQLFGTLAQQFAARGHDPRHVAHFLDKLLFCLFAEDARLLPAGIIGRLIPGSGRDPGVFVDGLRELFAKMSVGGGMFGAERVDWFNGGLFDGDDVLPVERLDMKVIEAVGKLNWAKIEPAIFGTLFERSLDPGQRAQLGAHYTDRQSIWRLVEPVILVPLRREFEAIGEIQWMLPYLRVMRLRRRLARFRISGRHLRLAHPEHLAIGHHGSLHGEGGTLGESRGSRPDVGRSCAPLPPVFGGAGHGEGVGAQPTDPDQERAVERGALEDVRRGLGPAPVCQDTIALGGWCRTGLWEARAARVAGHAGCSNLVATVPW
jgi:hypothetical protein